VVPQARLQFDRSCCQKLECGKRVSVPHSHHSSAVHAALSDLLVACLQVKRARSKQLQPDEFMSGTFTISNLGNFGADSFDAILPPGARRTLWHPRHARDDSIALQTQRSSCVCLQGLCALKIVLTPLRGSAVRGRTRHVGNSTSSKGRCLRKPQAAPFCSRRRALLEASSSWIPKFRLARSAGAVCELWARGAGTAAILAVGGSKPTVTADAAGRIGVQKQMTVNLTADHRIVYGADAAEFLLALKAVIENPEQLTL
jgi:hypothetical protein